MWSRSSCRRRCRASTSTKLNRLWEIWSPSCRLTSSTTTPRLLNWPVEPTRTTRASSPSKTWWTRCMFIICWEPSRDWRCGCMTEVESRCYLAIASCPCMNWSLGRPISVDLSIDQPRLTSLSMFLRLMDWLEILWLKKRKTRKLARSESSTD